MTAPGSEGRSAGLPAAVRPSHVPEEGSGTVLVMAACAVLVFVLVAVTAVAGVVTDVHRARSAVDLAALAAVAPLLTGAPPDCAAAARVAAVNAARVSSCAVLGDGSVLVEVTVPVRGAGIFTLAGVLPPVVFATARSGVSAERL